MCSLITVNFEIHNYGYSNLKLSKFYFILSKIILLLILFYFILLFLLLILFIFYQ
jgi:hypothetical protein